VPSSDLVCALFKALLPASLFQAVGGGVTNSGLPDIGAPKTSTSANAAAVEPDSPLIDSPAVGAKSLVDQLTGLLAGAK